jgi:hypothetical protein
VSRGLALLLAIIGGGLAAFAAVVAFVAVTAGVLWIYVFGDNPWPAWVDPVMGALMFLIGAVVWFVAARLIWKRLTAPAAG